MLSAPVAHADRNGHWLGVRLAPQDLPEPVDKFAQAIHDPSVPAPA
jgi:hypothetical protein